ncbi:MAG: manganese-binding transcriptional regulator MntR [Granulosicoccus sp.]|nr:manganese-binding transcriptional regulator MntR [Granulosicoccus sp.]
MSADMPERSPERPMQDPDAQAEVFAVVRQAHQMESTEDYVELIDDLIRTQGEARLVEVAERLGISQPSASKTIARLQREGFVTSEPYRSLFLTDKGRELAHSARRRHDLVYRFLLCIGVSETTAKIDSEGVEHHVSAETLSAFKRIIDERQVAASATNSSSTPDPGATGKS